MSHLFRFIGEPLDAETWRLPEEEAYHLAKVLRFSVGTAVEVTDGNGTWAAGKLKSATAREALIELSAPAVVEPVPSVALGFAIGALKPGAIDELLPSFTELGIDEIHIFAQMDGAKSRVTDKATQRWRRILSQSLKQCKRSRLPLLQEHSSVYDFITAVASGWPTRVVLEPGTSATLSSFLASHRPTRILVTAGGEKGLTPTEAKLLTSASFTPCRLGPHVLRAVTASLSAASVLSLYREDHP